MASPLEGVSTAAGIVQVLAILAGGRQESMRLRAATQADEYNAAVNRSRAETSALVYGQQEERQRRMARSVIGEAAAGAAQSGLGTGGSNADIQRQSEVLSELDALNIRYQGQLDRQSYLAQSELDQYNASSNRYAAGQARLGSYIGAGASALSNIGQYYKTQEPKTKRPVRRG